MQAKNPATEQEAELAEATRLKRFDAIFGTIRHALSMLALVTVAFFLNSSIHALAGQTTVADIGVGFLANVKVSEAVAWLFGTAGIGFGVAQGRLRRRTATRQGRRLRELEQLIDSERSSSNYEE